MIFEVVALALVSTVRPTSLAAVYAILSDASARRYLFAYVVTGLSCTIAFGVLVVGASHGIDLHTGSDRTKAIADIAGGIVMLGLGIVVLTGRLPRRPTSEATGPGGGLQKRLGGKLTMRTAAVAGPLTHIPGIFYLVALNVIVAHNVRAAEALVAVVTYNAIWFTLPLLALVTCIVRPAAARELVEAVRDWVRAHSRTILLATAFLVGPALVVRGVLNL